MLVVINFDRQPVDLNSHRLSSYYIRTQLLQNFVISNLCQLLTKPVLSLNLLQEKLVGRVIVWVKKRCTSNEIGVVIVFEVINST